MRFLFAILLCALAALCAPADSFQDELRNGLTALQKNDLPLAKQTLEHASTLQPDNALVWAALAQTYLRNQERALAVGAADKAAKLSPADPTIRHALALFWSQAGDAQQTIQWAAADLSSRDTAETHHLLAEAYWASHQPDQAVAEYRAAVRLAPQTESYVFDLGQAQLRHGDFAAALATFDPARKAFPKSAQIELAYGVAAYGQRRFGEAIDSFLRVISIDPSVEQAYVFMVRILDDAGDRMPRVLSALSAWRDASPRKALPWCLHAKALAASGGDPAKVEEELRRSIELNDRFWESHFELGLLLAKKREWQPAAAELSRSIELNAQNAGAHFQLARVYDRLGMKDQARAERAIHERMTAAETGLDLAGSAGRKDVAIPE